jgi:hypothetical protein
MIDFFTNDDLKKILDLVHSNEKKNVADMMDNFINQNANINPVKQNGLTGQENQNEKEKLENSSPDETQSVSLLQDKAEGIQKNEIIAEKENNNYNQEQKPKIISMGSDFQQPQSQSEQSEQFSQISQSAPVQQPQPEENKIKLDDDIEIIPNTNKREEDEENNTINPVPDFSQTEDEVEENKTEEHHEDNDDLYSLKDFTI